MTDATLDVVLNRILTAHADGLVSITWQGGEPTLAGLPFFQRAFARARELARPGQQVVHAFQTNGLLLDADWAKLFRREGVLVGLSCDGPPGIHDLVRRDLGGAGSSSQVLRAWDILKSESVACNLLCTVSGANVDRPLETYRYFRDDLKASHIQFVPLVQSGDGGECRETHFSQRLGAFLVAVYEEWVRRDIGIVSVQLFEAALAQVLKLPSLCILMPQCGSCPVLERDGSLRCCDHFAGDAHRVEGFEALRAFGSKKRELTQACLDCDVLSFCFGGCPAGRGPEAALHGQHWLCEGWKLFFGRVKQDMEWMAQRLVEGGQPAELMARYSNA